MIRRFPLHKFKCGGGIPETAAYSPNMLAWERGPLPTAAAATAATTPDPDPFAMIPGPPLTPARRRLLELMSREARGEVLSTAELMELMD